MDCDLLVRHNGGHDALRLSGIGDDFRILRSSWLSSICNRFGPSIDSLAQGPSNTQDLMLVDVWHTDKVGMSKLSLDFTKEALSSSDLRAKGFLIHLDPVSLLFLKLSGLAFLR